MNKSYVLRHSRYSGILFGPERPRIRELPIKYGGDPNKVCLVKFASNRDHPGFTEAKSPKFGLPESDDFDVYADIVTLSKPKSALVLQTADCLTALLYEWSMHRLVAVHCGRPALTPQNKVGEKIKNVMTVAYEALTFGLSKPQVDAYLTGGICGDCFVHDRPEARELIKPFEQFGDIAFNDHDRGSLNIPRIVTHQLIGLGVNFGDIKHDGFCTKESDWLTSYRDNPGPRNAIVVILD